MIVPLSRRLFSIVSHDIADNTDMFDVQNGMNASEMRNKIAAALQFITVLIGRPTAVAIFIAYALLGNKK